LLRVGRYGCRFDGLDDLDTMGRVSSRERGREGGGRGYLHLHHLHLGKGLALLQVRSIRDQPPSQFACHVGDETGGVVFLGREGGREGGRKGGRNAFEYRREREISQVREGKGNERRK